MSTRKFIWLASYPRSGNTFLRTVLHHCFGLRSASVYPDDLGGNKKLEEYVGHIEHATNGKIVLPPGTRYPIIKTHEVPSPSDDNPAIYVVRDGRDATLSLYDYYQKQIPLEKIISGQVRFGTWSNHVAAWSPWNRPHTLFVRFENIINDLPALLQQLQKYLGLPILTDKIPDRNAIVNIDGTWVREKKAGTRTFPVEHLELFERVNGEMMQKLGYDPVKCTWPADSVPTQR